MAADLLPALVGADLLHVDEVTGRGVTVAVVDGVTAPGPAVLLAGDGHDRLLAFYDVLGDRERAARTPETDSGASDENLEAMLSSRRDADGRYYGVAPDADLVLIRAVGPDGTCRPDDVVRAIAWVVANRDRYGIRVLNLPLAGRAWARFADRSLSQAVLEAWQAGVVVVVPAGNGGPSPATIATPGDLPEVITVGAFEPLAGGELVPEYSASGPTLGGFVKPEIIAPAGPEEAAPTGARVGSIGRPTAGTAHSSAVVSGVVALLLEASPWLSPDEVKERLVASARPAVAPGGEVLSVLRQGAGMVDALGAIGVPAGDGADRWTGDRGFTWSDSAFRGITWSDASFTGITWSDAALRGITWSDAAFRGITWSDAAFREITSSDRGSRGLTWSD